MGWVVNATPPSLNPLERAGSPTMGGWVGPRAGLDGEKLASIGIRYRDRPVCSKSLYRLSYASPISRLVVMAKL